MTTFHLYRSGIHDVTLLFDEEAVFCQKRDITDNTWQDEHRLFESEAANLETYYHINPLAIYKRFHEYQTLFQTNETEVETSWGARYSQDVTNTSLWVEREKKYPLDVVVSEGKPVAFISLSRENISVLVQEGYETCTPVKWWQDGSVSAAVYGVRHIGTQMVSTRDDVHLATDIWLPDAPGASFPVIFVRTPYGRMSYEHAYVNFIQRGYAVVIQDARGRQDSEGEWIPMYHEVEDGDDSISWIVAQAWCNGNIGMIGASYGGYVQWAAAASGNPHLKALVSIVTAGSPFTDIPRKGGAFVSGMLAWAFAVMEKTFQPQRMVRDDWNEVLNSRPIKDIPKKVLGLDVPFWDQWMRHSRYDAFWEASSWRHGADNMHASALIVSGWFDDNGMGTTEALDVTKSFKAGDKKVLLGPWLHNGNTTRDIQGVHLGNNALRYDLDYIYQQWFDHKLKGIENGIQKEPTVEYYDTGINRWQHARAWPPQQVTWTSMYLDADEADHTSRNKGALGWHPPQSESRTSFVYDPDDPAPQILDMSENEVGVPADYQTVEARDDVLVFSTPPLEESVTVTGDIRATLYAASTAKDTDWIVRITDVAPDGSSTKLADGVLRARFRHGYDREELLEPGRVEKYTIRTSKLANTFKRGHRIRLNITSSASNFIFPNTNTGNDPFSDTETVPATQTIYHSPAYPSHIDIPLM